MKFGILSLVFSVAQLPQEIKKINKNKINVCLSDRTPRSTRSTSPSTWSHWTLRWDSETQLYGFSRFPSVWLSYTVSRVLFLFLSEWRILGGCQLHLHDGAATGRGRVLFWGFFVLFCCFFYLLVLRIFSFFIILLRLKKKKKQEKEKKERKKSIHWPDSCWVFFNFRRGGFPK